MSEITSGIRSIFSHPFIYSGFQRLLGAHSFREKFVEEFVRPGDEAVVLDIGCGPADILDCLPNTIQYEGFDISDSYIEKARMRYQDRGSFHCKILTQEDLKQLPKFDIVLALGVLHHMDDGVAQEVLNIACHALKPGGRFVTFDPCLEKGQNPIARLLVKMDRGQNVRTQAGYEALAKSVFESSRVEVRHQAWIPYTHCFMECIRK